jgi:hypothetical protein
MAGTSSRSRSGWDTPDPGFTLRTYVHLMDAGVGDADFFDDAVGTDDEG